MARRILILFAHPAIRRSRFNRVLIETARMVEGVTVHDLYETYPDFAVDPDREQALLLEHDVIVAQHPLFWYSAPALLKEWLDLVLEHGWAYGREGHRLDGKLWMQAVTAGGSERAYSPDGLNHWSIDELLRPFEATANLCRMVWQPPFVLHGAHLADAQEIDRAARAYQARLTTLRDGTPVRAVTP
ncbi:NAD(P)H-dependent oxidoreductase [Chthonobacter rhizosphaerae]|uniref:glutathione-regulated potassium-efflux system oxidoreductase KefF n=1 Tax=Chthonobacter rhizosphaerae TaxID=2735553 RepID=UPI0015EFD1A4|nr:NAD(P)H-dependent oxidoreductase [Chthonobacter rhizosphaerae]